MVQLCLGDQRALSEFTNVMRSIAKSEHMDFVDGSAQAKHDLEATNALRQVGPIIHMGLEREDGMGLVAGNIGLPGYQVALGFSSGSSQSSAHTFAAKVVSELKKRWHVESVPVGRGALPLNGCAS